MINEEQYNLHKSIIEWLISQGLSFIHAIGVVCLMELGDSLPQAVANLENKE